MSIAQCPADAHGVRIVDAGSEADVVLARSLFEEYAEQLGVDLCFQNFSSELRSLGTMYGAPAGCLLLAWHGDAAVGCVGARRISPTECEMKRLYVRDAARGLGIGRQLTAALIDRARGLGYERMVLDTLEGMTAARRLYASLGFRRCAPYYPNPLAGVTYMALELASSAI